jgi:uncharacterized membrane protein YvbJ
MVEENSQDQETTNSRKEWASMRVVVEVALVIIIIVIVIELVIVMVGR